MYIIQCKRVYDGDFIARFYLKKTDFTDEFTSKKSDAKQYKKELAAMVDIRHVKENNRRIECEIVEDK